MFCKRYRIHHKNDYNKQGTPCIGVATKFIKKSWVYYIMNNEEFIYVQKRKSI